MTGPNTQRNTDGACACVAGGAGHRGDPAHAREVRRGHWRLVAQGRAARARVRRRGGGPRLRPRVHAARGGRPRGGRLLAARLPLRHGGRPVGRARAAAVAPLRHVAARAPGRAEGVRRRRLRAALPLHLGRRVRAAPAVARADGRVRPRRRLVVGGAHRAAVAAARRLRLARGRGDRLGAGARLRRGRRDAPAARAVGGRPRRARRRHLPARRQLPAGDRLRGGPPVVHGQPRHHRGAVVPPPRRVHAARPRAVQARPRRERLPHRPRHPARPVRVRGGRRRAAPDPARRVRADVVAAARL